MFVGIKWYRPNNESYEGSDNKDPDVDFEQLVNQVEEGEDDDWGLPPQLKDWLNKKARK